MTELQYQVFDGNKIHLHLRGGSVLMGSSAPPLHSVCTPPQKNSGGKNKIRTGRSLKVTIMDKTDSAYGD